MAEGAGPAYEFWLRVERERVARGWSQAELTRRAGPPPSSINRLKTGLPRISVVHSLADALGIDRVEAAQLAGLLPRMPDRESQEARPISLREQILADPILNEKEKRAVLDVYEAFVAGHRARGVARLDTSDVLARSDDGKEAI